jgi:DNA-binding NarL/FixJ family response regulator
VDNHSPDVVILDSDTLGEEIVAILSFVRQLERPPTIVAMSIRAENRKTAIETGIDGFAHKGEPPECLLAVAVRQTKGRNPARLPDIENAN